MLEFLDIVLLILAVMIVTTAAQRAIFYACQTIKGLFTVAEISPFSRLSAFAIFTAGLSFHVLSAYFLWITGLQAGYLLMLLIIGFEIRQNLRNQPDLTELTKGDFDSNIVVSYFLIAVSDVIYGAVWYFVH